MTKLIDVGSIVYSRMVVNNGDIFVPLKDISDAPTVDAVPVVHGHWEFGCGGSYGGILQVDLWDCSCCGESCGYKSKYCPNCGAKMNSDSSG